MDKFKFIVDQLSNNEEEIDILLIKFLAKETGFDIKKIAKLVAHERLKFQSPKFIKTKPEDAIKIVKKYLGESMNICKEIREAIMRNANFDEIVADIFFSKDKEEAEYIKEEIEDHPKIRTKKLKVEKAKGYKGFIVKVVWYSLGDKVEFGKEKLISYNGPSDYRREIEKELMIDWKKKGLK